MQLPLGIFGVAIGTVTLPLVSRSAASGDTAGFRSTLAHGLRLAFLLTIPSTIGLVLLAPQIVSLIYERGLFDANSTQQTAAALQCYAVGLCAYSGIKVLAPAFYAIDQRSTPMLVSFASIATNLFLNWLLTFHLQMGHRGLALSTGIVALLNFCALYFLMWRETKALESRQMLVTLFKLAFASAALGGVCWAGQKWVLAGWAHFGLAVRAGSLGAVIAVGGLVFFGVALLLQVKELDALSGVIRRRLGRRPRAV